MYGVNICSSDRYPFAKRFIFTDFKAKYENIHNLSRRPTLTSSDIQKPKEQFTFDQNMLKPKRKHPTFLQNLADYFTEFSGSSSIHGIRYIGEQKRTIAEKLWWILVFGASLYICIFMIIKTYNKWQSSPVIVSFARSPTPVWQIPFPAVTICSETKSRQSEFNFTDIYNRDVAHNLTTEEEADLEKISLVCDNHLHTRGNDTISYDTMDFLAKVSPPFSQIFYECEWMNEKHDCSSLFTPMLTEEGICFTFNMLDRQELFRSVAYEPKDYLHHNMKSTNWSLEDGYPKYIGKDAFPRRTVSAGQAAGLAVVLRLYEKDLDYICRGPVQGFKILLHHPAEVPRVSQQYFRADLNQEIVVAIKPDMMTTSEGLRDYHPHRRQCYFPSERYLRFYQVYTQQNCEVECLTNFTLQRCGCVSFHMPHDKNTPLCGSGKTLCAHNSLVALFKQEVEKSMSALDAYSTTYDADEHQECDCLPACTSLMYSSENSQATLNWEKVFEAKKADMTGLKGANLTGVTLFFKEMQFITSERSELYGPTDFLASCGGLLGLFMGFSFLSIVELMYFLTLRLICNIKNFGRHFWSGSESLLSNDAYEHKH